MTARLDVTRLRAECDRLGVHFYAAFIWCTSNVVNRLPFMKMMTDERRQSGSVGCCTPELYDLPTKKDHTFSDCWSEYDDDFATFYKRIEADIEAAKKVRGIKAKADSRRTFTVFPACHGWSTSDMRHRQHLIMCRCFRSLHSVNIQKITGN